MVLHFKQYYITQVTCCSKICYHTSNQGPEVSDTSVILTSQVCASAIFLILIKGNSRLGCLPLLQLCNVCTRHQESQSSDLNFKWAETNMHTHYVVILKVNIFPCYLSYEGKWEKKKTLCYHLLTVKSCLFHTCYWKIWNCFALFCLQNCGFVWIHYCVQDCEFWSF
jgi:hypothetical protein